MPVAEMESADRREQIPGKNQVFPFENVTFGKLESLLWHSQLQSAPSVGLPWIRKAQTLLRLPQVLGDPEESLGRKGLLGWE